MMYQEFNKIAGKVADPSMYSNEVETIYMEFEAITKKEMAVLYWGDRKGAYGIYLEMKDLMRYINALREKKDDIGLIEAIAWQKVTEMKLALVERVKALKVA